MRPVVLSGFMGAGKSTVGPPLAARLGVPFLDTDEMIAREAGVSVPDLWRQGGEAAFRSREQALAGRLLDDPSPKVIAFGGGTVTNRRTRQRTLERATLVTLTAKATTLLSRVKDLAARPNLDAPDPLGRIEELLDQRADAYAECHASIATDARDPEDVVREILTHLERDLVVMPLGRRTYPIELTRGAPRCVAEALARAEPSHIVLVTDATVKRARGWAIEEALAAARTPHTTITLPAGEANKTLASVATIWDAALGAGVDRRALVLGFGGGVVGDLAGFAAATLLRGIRVVQVPTTLLAMVDASVGGKTGFDHVAGKNLIGAFHQPSAVVVDLEHLSTLPERARNAGLAEIVKIAMVVDEPLLEEVEASAEKLSSGDLDALAVVVRRAVLAKIRVVCNDERETGERVLLNLGHTVGHAIEAHGAYVKTLHGEAVGLGMLSELGVGVALGRTPPAVVERTRALLERLGLPTNLPPSEIAQAWRFVRADKKRDMDMLRIPVVTRPGHAVVERVPVATIRAALGA